MQQKTILVVGLNSRNDGHINSSPALNFQTSLFHVEILILLEIESVFSLSLFILTFYSILILISLYFYSIKNN